MWVDTMDYNTVSIDGYNISMSDIVRWYYIRWVTRWVVYNSCMLHVLIRWVNRKCENWNVIIGIWLMSYNVSRGTIGEIMDYDN
jgi:hypothetical protein